MTRKFLLTFLTGAILAAGTTLASAATVTLGASGFSPSVLPVVESLTGNVEQDVTGSIVNQRADPWASTAFAGTGAYTAVGANSSATYSLGTTRQSFSFLWGTPDSYNTLSLLLNGVVVDSVAGDQTGIVGFADQTTNRFVTVSSEFEFDGLRFSSSGIAFEYAAIQPAAVPLPAAGGLLLLAVGGGAMALRRKRG